MLPTASKRNDDALVARPILTQVFVRCYLDLA